MRMLIILWLRRDTLELVFCAGCGCGCCLDGLDKWIHYNRSWRFDVSNKVRIVSQFLITSPHPQGSLKSMSFKRTKKKRTSWLKFIYSGMHDIQWYFSPFAENKRKFWSDGSSAGLLILPGCRSATLSIFPEFDLPNDNKEDVGVKMEWRMGWDLKRGGRFSDILRASSVGSCGHGCGGRPVDW